MSSIYISEPSTEGKVILHTTLGDLEVELWPKQAPKACRNFVQLCMEGYYDNTIFHRVVKGFIVQGGDPTGSGFGGESIYGQPFEDEFHSRLRFTRRGLLAMANTTKNDNTSQFFFTLDRTEELNRKNTIFGTLVGETVFNVLKIGEVDTDANEKPLYPVRIVSVEVLSNPFTDIVPRTTAEEKKKKLEEEKRKREEAEKKAKESKVKAKKDFSLLSFGEEAQDEEEHILRKKKHDTKPKSKSSHDLLKNDPRLVQQVAVEVPIETKKRALEMDNGEEDYDVVMRDKVRRKMEEKRKEKLDEGGRKESTANDKKEKDSTITTIRSEIESLKSQLKQPQKPIESNIPKPPEPVSFLEAELARYKSSGKAIIGRGGGKKSKNVSGVSEDDVLAKLASFQSKLHSFTYGDDGGDKKKSKKKEKKEDDVFICALHSKKNCLSCRDTFGEDGKKVHDEDIEEVIVKGDGWMNHTLKFEEDNGDKGLFKVDDYVVLDPREEARKTEGNRSGSGSKHHRERERERDRDRDYHRRDRDERDRRR